MQRLKILVDLDDVLCDWTAAAIKTFGINAKSPAIIDLLSKNWGIQEILDEDLMWETLDRLGSSWWANLDICPWARQLYSTLKKMGDVCILTSPSEHPSSLAGKAEWIKKHFDTRDFLVGKPKYFCAHGKAILIDDRPKNCQEFSDHGGNFYTWPCPIVLKSSSDPNGFAEIDKLKKKILEIHHRING